MRTRLSLPAAATITPAWRDNGIEVRVQFAPDFRLSYTYDYEFDHTVKSTAFLTIK